MSSLHSVIKKKKKKVPSEGGSLASAPSYLAGVIEKLRKHPEYKGKCFEELRDKAIQLTDVNELQADFSHLTHEKFELFSEEMLDEADATLEHRQEIIEAQTRAVKRLCPIPVKLLLRELQDTVPRFITRFSRLFALKYGPLHAAIQVGDVLLEWDDSSLVIPDRCSLPDPVFQTDINRGTTAVQEIMELQPQIATAVGHMDYNQQIELLFDITASQEKMINKIKDVIVKYNKLYSYHVILRNCQAFVEDVMKEIGVQDVLKVTTGKLKEYFNFLTRNKSDSVPSVFKDHEELDKYVQDTDLSGLTQHDKEYLLCLYFHFHQQAMKVDKDPNEECRVKDCCMEKIEKELEGSNMLLENYK